MSVATLPGTSVSASAAAASMSVVRDLAVEREAARLPGEDAAGQRVRLVAGAAERVRGHRRAPADTADEHDRRVAVDARRLDGDRRERDMTRAGDPPGVPFVLLAHVDQLDGTGALQLGDLVGRDVHRADGTVRRNAMAQLVGLAARHPREDTDTAHASRSGACCDGWSGAGG